MPKISIKAEPILQIFGFTVTNSLLLSSIVFIFVLIIGIIYTKHSSASKKSGFFYFMNFMLKNVYTFFESVLKENTEYFFPLLASFFLYILFQNWFGLLPGVGSIVVEIVEEGHKLSVPLFRGNNADLNATVALGLLSIILVQVFGVRFLGFGTYIKKFINLKSPIDFFVGILEIISEFSRILSFSFRLFGNIFAGEVLLTIVAFLVPFLASMPFLFLEIFVGFVQAMVFSMLSAVFISSAITAHHD